MKYTRTPLTTSKPFDLDAVKEYARIDFSDGDTTLEAMAAAAAAEIEAACNLALLSQTITATTEQWPGSIIDLPVGPVAQGATAAVSVIEADGTLTPVTSGWWLEAGRYPRLHFTTTPGARLHVVYNAGYGSDANAIPPDLAVALQDQTLRLYDTRSDFAIQPGIAPAAARIIARHLRVKL